MADMELVRKRAKALRLFFVRDLTAQDIAEAMDTTAEDVEELAERFVQYFGEPKYPRARPQREDAAEVSAPKTRARTSSTAGETRTMTAAEAESNTNPIVAPPRRGNDEERAGFAPGAAA